MTFFFGLTFDYPFFTMLQQQMFNHLRKIYPELEIGTYTHIALPFIYMKKILRKLKK